ncbi:MAG: sugar ABC transporter permease [Spirochaetaceae bacterium]|nr:MAG: sugar ABC transporter permease [Spirochaetaceae bacterium]
MVGSKFKRWLYFCVFVLPALAAYALFFINPFAQGIRISFTNWDGTTPRTPISMAKGQFEEQILSRIEREEDRDFLLRIYSLDPADSQYKRYELTGSDRNRIVRILNRVGYRPETFRYVGLKNFIDIFSGRVEERFYPRRYTRVNYNQNSQLPLEIPLAEFEKVFMGNLNNEEERSLAGEVYERGEEAYTLRTEFDEFTLEDRIWLLPEVDVAYSVPPNAVDELIASVREAGLADDQAALQQAVSRFLDTYSLSASSAAEVREAARDIYNLGEFKRLLAERWVERKFELGVVGFTLFFMFFNVLFSNLLAFMLALALDQKLKSRNILRTIFFLPNVLSMIVVALVWSFVFFNLMPALTGIELWMGDPGKAPWLIVMVQVWREAGYLMVIYLAGLQSIPTDVHEAALIDGAKARQKLRYVVLPLLVPALTICLFLSLSNSLKSFDLVYAMVGPSGYALGTVPFVMDIFFDAFAKRLAGLATAKAMLLFIAILLITGVQLTVMKRREVRL